MMNDTDKAWAVFKARQSMDEVVGYLTTLCEDNKFKPLQKKAMALYKLLEKEEGE